jgi:PAS domain S-box-containing protein
LSKRESGDLRRKAEEQLAEREGQIKSLERADLESLSHELAVHQVELEIQNEELRRSRADAEEARDHYLDLFDFAPVGYFTLDKHNLIVEANLTACQLLKIDRIKLLKRSFTKFINPAESDRFYLRRKQLENNARQSGELQMQKADGTAFDAQLISVKVGEEKLRLAVMDITERKKAEQLKDEFIGMVSHELKTPLTVIMGALSTATDERVSQERSRELIRDAVVHSEILASIIDNLLELSRRQSGRLSLQIQPINVGEIAQNVIGKLQNKSAIHRLVSDFPLALHRH